jgi:hypothetical protein
MIASYLTAEREAARIAADADIDTFAPTGSGPGTCSAGGRHRPRQFNPGNRAGHTRECLGKVHAAALTS